MPHKIRTAGEASLMLHQYEELNKDLPAGVRRQLALFVLAPRTGIPVLAELFQSRLGKTPIRHVSWFWWNAMRSSGLEHLWDEFVTRKNNNIPMADCLIRVRRKADPENWKTLSRRAGTAIFQGSSLLNPHRYRRTPTKGLKVWTKGGVWDRRNNFTKIIVLGEHLTGRDYAYSQLTKKLDDASCGRIETEIHNFVDPDDLLYPDAYLSACDYARVRIQKQVEWKRNVGDVSLSWFFQGPVLVPGGRVSLFSRERPRMTRITHYPLEWFEKY